jgi:hypothetical protein
MERTRDRGVVRRHALGMELYEWQVPSAAKLLECLQKYRVAFNGSDRGTGKTPVASQVAKMLERPTVVVCPKSVRSKWTDTLRAIGVRGKYSTINYEKLRTGKTAWGGWEKAGRGKRWVWNLEPETLIIWDEVQKCKAMDSLNSKMLLGSKKFYNLPMSANAVESPLDLRSLGYVLGLHDGRDGFFQFLSRHGVKRGAWGGFVFEEDEAKAKEHINRIHLALRPLMARIRIEDLGDAFVHNQVFAEPYDFEDADKIQSLYEEIDRLLIRRKAERMAEGEEYEITGLTKTLYQRIEIENLKLPLFNDLVREEVEDGNSVAVFLNFAENIDKLASSLSELNPSRFYGRQNEKTNQAHLSAFQANRTKVILLSLDKGGDSITLSDTTGNHPRVSFFSPDYDGRQVFQALGRIHRADSKSPCRQYIVYVAGTAEDSARKAADRKIGRQSVFNDGRVALQSLEAKTPRVGTGVVPEVGRRQPEVHSSQPPVLSKSGDSDPHLHPSPDPLHAECGPHSMTQEVRPPIDEAKRTKFAPSILNYVEKCPGYRNDKSGRKDAADKGAELHEQVETGKITATEPADIEAVTLCIAYEEERSKGAKIYKELDLPVLDHHGFLDTLIVRGNSATIIDWKFGKNQVPDAEINKQGYGYALAVWDKYPEIEEIEVHFVMPFIDWVSIAKFTRAADYDRIKLALRVIIERAKAAWPENEEVPHNPGRHCLYCGMLGRCKAVGNKALSVGVKYDNLPVPIEVHSSQIFDPADMARAFELAKVMENWAKSVKTHAIQMRLEGQEIPGYELGERSGRRSISNAQAAWEIVKDQISPEDFAGCATVSLPDLEKLFSANAPRGKKGEWMQKLQDELINAGALDLGQPTYFLKQTKEK